MMPRVSASGDTGLEFGQCELFYVELRCCQPTDSVEQSPLKANSSSASQKIPLILWNAKFPTVFTMPTTCPYPELDQSRSRLHAMSWFILILPSHLCLGLPSGLCPLGFHTRTLYATFAVSLFVEKTAHYTGNSYELQYFTSVRYVTALKRLVFALVFNETWRIILFGSTFGESVSLREIKNIILR